MTLYFAYGSNMDRAAMARRCPAATALGPARLDGHTYRVNQDGYATIVAHGGRVVHGVLWRLKARDVTALDLYEAVAEGLYARATIRVGFGERTLKAITYVAARLLEGRPRPLYQEAVVRAADDWGLPPAYVQELVTWLPLPSRLARQAQTAGRAR
jgi:gamma-glutamylcyclotransferase (GGCT)/AIG2-like uncharacterized protein YtfP